MTYTDHDKQYKRYTITSALPYANGPVHIGHLAGVYVPADIYARYMRSNGNEVLFIGGSDEHGVPITIKARKEGCTPQDIVDRYHTIIRDSFKELGISFDIYSRTSSEEHHKTAAAYFKKLYEEGKFVEKVSQQYYDEEAQQFLADRYITGTCPHCGNEHAYGDQCEACGTSLNATDLINPKSMLSGSKPVLKETKHWFLPLDQDEPWLRQWILEQHKGDWKSNVYGQCKSWIDAGLQPRAVTRDLDWGVKVPLEGVDGKVLYVWFDAPIGYISFTKQHCGDDWEKWWKDHDTKLVHFIGKDNIVFHCIIFPSMQKADGNYPPRQCARQRVSQPRRRQNQHLAQLGRVVARIPARLPRQTGRAALHPLQQRPRDQRQRLHLERLPTQKQQRTGGHPRQLRQPHPRTHPQVLWRQGTHLYRHQR